MQQHPDDPARPPVQEPPPEHPIRSRQSRTMMTKTKTKTKTSRTTRG